MQARLDLSFAVMMFTAVAALGQGGITLVDAGYTAPTPIRVAPGQIVTFRLTGLKTVLPATAPIQRASSVPLPTSLAGISATLTQTVSTTSEQLPLFAVQQFNNCGMADSSSQSPDCMITALTVQIPFDLSVPNPLVEAPVVRTATIIIRESGESSRSFLVIPVSDNIHILTSCDLLVNGTIASCDPIVTHGDGKPVNLSNPARIGEELVMYAVGLGMTSPVVTAGTATPTPAPVVASQAGVTYDYIDPLGVLPSASGGAAAAPLPSTLFAGLTPSLVGLYQVNFRILPPPGQFPSCSAVGPNLTLTLKTPQGTSDKGSICVDTTSATPTIASSAGTLSSWVAVPSIGRRDFVPNTIPFASGSDLRSFGKPVPPESLGVPGPNVTAIAPPKP